MQDNKERKMSENTGSFIKKKRQYQEMGMKILHTCRSEICARFPFFSYASAALSAAVETKMFSNSMENENSSQSWIHGIGTDGERIIADPVFLIYTWAACTCCFTVFISILFLTKRWKKDCGMWPVIWLWSF